MKNLLVPIGVLAVGLLLLFGGSALENAEEGIANSFGSILGNTWFAVGLLIVGGIWLYSTTGHFKRITA
jgi:hypothetical protein